MIWDDYKRFDNYCNTHHVNRFAQINKIAKISRRLADQENNRVLHSEAISWCVSGETPKILSMPQLPRSDVRIVQAYVDDTLFGVDNLDVVDSVRVSIRESFRANHLIYVYSKVLDECTCARIRILTNMIWWKFHTYIEGE